MTQRERVLMLMTHDVGRLRWRALRATQAGLPGAAATLADAANKIERIARLEVRAGPVTPGAVETNWQESAAALAAAVCGL